MSNETHRELERKWRETGSLEDEQRYIAELIRVGQIDQDRVKIAAYLGHQAARAVAGADAPLIGNICNVVSDLAAFGEYYEIRAVVAVLRTLPLPDAAQKEKADEFIAAILAFIDRPLPKAKGKLSELLDAIRQPLGAEANRNPFFVMSSWIVQYLKNARTDELQSAITNHYQNVSLNVYSGRNLKSIDIVTMDPRPLWAAYTKIVDVMAREIVPVALGYNPYERGK